MWDYWWIGVEFQFLYSIWLSRWMVHVFKKKHYRKMKIEIQRNNFFDVISRKIWNAMFSAQLKLFFLKHNFFRNGSEN